jgi:hypothetical protein
MPVRNNAGQTIKANRMPFGIPKDVSGGAGRKREYTFSPASANMLRKVQPLEDTFNDGVCSSAS